jgi:ABC-2 type transport system ATP-binding protein
LKIKKVLSISNASKRFRDVQALDKLTLEMGNGVFGLIGPNGAGKTTLLRILLGLIQADEGRIEVLGLDAYTESFEIRKRLGVLHEHPIYPPSLTVNHFLERVSKIYKSRENPIELLDVVGLSEAKQRKIGNLSAGMRQKLGVAQALIGKPELVFLDEPTSNLDVMARRDLLNVILNIHKEEGVSFCIISHVLSELERVCSDVAFINAGRSIVAGPIHEIITQYSSNQYTIIASDPRILHDELIKADIVERSEVTGAKAMTVIMRSDNHSTILAEIEQLAKSKEIKVYDIERTKSLEEAFLEVMRHE